MANINFRGDAVAVAEVRDFTFGGTWANGDTVTMTINAKSIVVTLGTTSASSVANVIDACVAAWNGTAVQSDETRSSTGNNITEFNEITASRSGTTIFRLTNDTAGKTFATTMAKSSASGTISAVSVSTAAAGPNVLTAANVSGGALPGVGDVFLVEDSAVDLLYNLDATSGTLNSTKIKASYTGEIGLNRFTSTSYAEYRTRELTINTTELRIGEGKGDGSGRLLINLGSVQSTVSVFKTGTALDDSFHTLRIRGTHASNSMLVYGSSTVDIAAEAEQTATFNTLTVTGSSRVRTSPGTTLGTIVVAGTAVLEIHSAAGLTDIAKITLIDRATLILYGDNGVTEIECFDNSTFDDRGSGTITTVQKGPSANITTKDSSVAVGARTYTNTRVEAGAGKFEDPGKKLTFTNPIDFGIAKFPKDFPNLDLGNEVDIQRS